MRHLYVHVPFCPTICPYCDFHVVRRGKGLVPAFLKRLATEAGGLYERRGEALKTLYVGGGTPSYLRDAELEELFAALPWRLEEGAEVTLEVNPGTANRERLRRLRGLGVNRLSIGVQSFDDRLLRFLGRNHTAAVAAAAIAEAATLGFSVSLDLILGLPGQDPRRELKEAVSLGADHVSAYTLQVEPGTPFALQGVRVDPDDEARAFASAREVLGEAGFERYEVSNFARPGAASLHNLAYWRMDSWGGLGPGAAAHFLEASAGVVAQRLNNPPLPRWLGGEPPHIVGLSALEYAKEALMMSLRARAGVDLELLAARTGLDLAPLSPAAAELAAAGLLAETNGRLSASDAGMDRLHEVILRLWEALEGAYPGGS